MKKSSRHETKKSSQPDSIVDPVMILVLVELETEEEVFHTKVRIRHSDIFDGETFTVADLRRKLRDSGLYTTASMDMSLWEGSSFRTLTDERENLMVSNPSSTRWKLRLSECTTPEPAALPIQGRYYDFDGTLLINGRKLQILETANVNDTTALNVWDGSILLAQYLERIQLSGQSILELGAGCGLSGMAAAALENNVVVLSDLAEALPQLERTIALNRLQDCASAVECDWTRPLSPQLLSRSFDYILVADCVWMEHLVDPLLNTLRTLTDRNRTRVDKETSPQSSHVDIYKQDNLSDSKLPESPPEFEIEPPLSSHRLRQPLPRISSVVDEAALLFATGTDNDNVPRVIISYQQRGKATHERFMEGLHEWFYVESIDFPKPGVFYLLSCTRKSTSSHS